MVRTLFLQKVRPVGSQYQNVFTYTRDSDSRDVI
jgi:hypothetical protein